MVVEVNEGVGSEEVVEGTGISRRQRGRVFVVVP